MPTLYILAGPNGTGKTTFYSFAVQSGFINKNLPFINVDVITQQLGGYSEENYIKAAEIYRATVKGYIDSKSAILKIIISPLCLLHHQFHLTSSGASIWLLLHATQSTNHQDGHNLTCSLTFSFEEKRACLYQLLASPIYGL